MFPLFFEKRWSVFLGSETDLLVFKKLEKLLWPRYIVWFFYWEIQKYLYCTPEMWYAVNEVGGAISLFLIHERDA